MHVIQNRFVSGLFLPKSSHMIEKKDTKKMHTFGGSENVCYGEVEPYYVTANIISRYYQFVTTTQLSFLVTLPQKISIVYGVPISHKHEKVHYGNVFKFKQVLSVFNYTYSLSHNYFCGVHMTNYTPNTVSQDQLM